jgi:c-di-GMP-binding flagellar brake protein YcgR
MDNTQSNGQNDDAADSGPDFGRRNALEIGAQLRNLEMRGDFLTVQYHGGQLVTRILHVDASARAFLFDWGALDEQNRGVLDTERCLFHAAPEGVRVEFEIGQPREKHFEGRPAFESAFPDILYVVQRRDYFRVDAPIVEPYVCRGLLPDGDSFRFEVHDLSLGGLGLRTLDERVARLPVGTVLYDVEIGLGSHGVLALDIELVSHHETTMPNGSRRHQIGFRFLTLPGSAENTLQRLITQLEMKRRSLTRA